MRFRERDQSSIRSYQRISLGKRKRLIEMVTNEGFSLSKVSKKLKLKLTTARLILKKFNETGTFPMRNFKKKSLKSHQTEDQQKEQVQLDQDSDISEKEMPEKEAKIEQQPYVRYYFVNQMPNVAYFSPFWPGPMLPWM